MFVFDLDDTLISTNFRQYSCLKSFFNLKKLSFIDFDTYITIRKDKQWSNTQVVNFFYKDINIEELKQYYIYHIESLEFLAIDTLIVKKQLLFEFSKDYKLVLLSLRSNKENSLNQLDSLGIKEYFNEIYFLKHKKLNPKSKFLKRYNKKIQGFIGDTATDFEAANDNNLKFYLVETGLYPLNLSNTMSFKTVNNFILWKKKN